MIFCRYRIEIAIGTGGWDEGPFYKFEHVLTCECRKETEEQEAMDLEIAVPEMFKSKILHFKVWLRRL